MNNYALTGLSLIVGYSFNGIQGLGYAALITIVFELLGRLVSNWK